VHCKLVKTKNKTQKTYSSKMEKKHYSWNPTVPKCAELDYLLYPHGSTVSYSEDISANVN